LETELTRKVSESLNELVDEETTRRFKELNIITEISEQSSGSVSIRFQPLSPYSPLAVDTGRCIRKAALSVEGVKSVRVECSGHMMDDLVNKLTNKEEIQQNKPE
jgi:metal-sulfur cluster biosynthetic enzyme